MRTKNQKKRNQFRVLVILCIVALVFCLILKLTGKDVNDWLFIADSLLLIVCGIMFKNYDRAVKEDEKYGNR